MQDNLIVIRISFVMMWIPTGRINMNFHRSKKILFPDFQTCFPEGWITIKTVILRNAILSAFSKSIKQLTHAGCQSEIPLNSSRFRSNRKFCYQSATKFSKMFWVGVGVYFTLDIWLEWHLRKYLGINSPNYFMYWCVGRCFLGGYRSNFWNGVIDWAW